MKVIDSHIHLATQWREGEAAGLNNPWVESEGGGFDQQWSEALYKERVGATEVQVEAAIFVECFNQGPLEEAQWTLKMAADPNSLVQGVIAHIPVQEGAVAVQTFLAAIKTNGALPKELKGARNVFLGDPMPPADACLEKTFLEGLAAMHEAHPDLIWEFAVQPHAIPHVTTVCKQFPQLSVVLNHLGHNAGGEDFETWAPAIQELSECNNVVLKTGAVEEWAVDDPARYLDCALQTFGYARCMYESNWFVNNAMGHAYDATFQHLLAACRRLGASEVETEAVFRENARRVYTLA